MFFENNDFILNRFSYFDGILRTVFVDGWFLHSHNMAKIESKLKQAVTFSKDANEALFCYFQMP